jgi:YfiH family protein
MIEADWPAPARVRALMTTRSMGDMAGSGRDGLRAFVPGEPVWLTQVHGTTVLDLDQQQSSREGDAALTRTPGIVCAVGAADCMPVLLTDVAGSVVGAAHAGWRGLCSGVIEATFSAMSVKPERTLAWLGPAIGPKVYEVGEEVREAFLDRDKAASTAFVATRAGHWLLDLYAVARQRLANMGVTNIYGGAACTYTDAGRFYSYRRDRTKARMAALIWLT